MALTLMEVEEWRVSSSNNLRSCVRLFTCYCHRSSCPGHHYEEIKRNRDELDINLKQYRKHYNLLKDDHDQLKRKVGLSFFLVPPKVRV